MTKNEELLSISSMWDDQGLTTDKKSSSLDEDEDDSKNEREDSRWGRWKHQQDEDDFEEKRDSDDQIEEDERSDEWLEIWRDGDDEEVSRK